VSAQLTQQLSFELLQYPQVVITASSDDDNAQIRIQVDNIGVYDDLSLVRVPSDNPEADGTPIRGATHVALSGISEFITFDTEAPLDTSFYYRVILDGAYMAQTTAAHTIQTDGMTFWVKDVIQGVNSVKVRLQSMSDVVRSANTLGTYKVLGRANPIIVTDVQQGRTGSMQLSTATSDDSQGLLDLFASGSTLLLQCPRAAHFPDMYFTAGDLTESWNGGTAFNQIHTFTFPFTESDSPSEQAFNLPSNAWLLVTQFDNWQDMLDKRITWQAVLISPFSADDL